MGLRWFVRLRRWSTLSPTVLYILFYIVYLSLCVCLCVGGVIVSAEHNPDGKGEKRLYSRSAHSYSPGERRWIERPRLPFEQNWGGACSLGGRLLLVGGAHRSQAAGSYVFDNRTLALRESA